MALEDMVDKHYKTAVIISDLQIPFQDKSAIEAVLKYIKDTKPDDVVLIGDALDCYEASDFLKNPKREFSLQDELDILKGYLKRIRKDIGHDAKLHYRLGNHEIRIPKMLMKHPEFASLKALELEELLDLKSVDCKFYHYGDKLTLGPIHVYHGDKGESMKMSGHSAYTGKANLDAKGVSGIQGHTHRMGSYYRTDESGTKQWHEVGCLCSLTPEYLAKPNWQQGFAVIRYSSDEALVDLIAIGKRGFIADGRFYSRKK